MRALKCFCLGVALLPAVLHAGQIYGSVSEAGRGVARAAIEIDCAKNVARGTTANDGSYRINVPQQGQCTLTLSGYAGRPSAVVFSFPNPAQYDFRLVKHPDGSYSLART